jgi:HSP20 family protein
MAVSTRRAPDQTSAQQPIQRWQPFSELEQLQSQMDQLMQSVWSGPGTGNGGIWIPTADIEETEDAWIVEAEVPGVSRKDINVELRDTELIISGEIKEKERKGILRRRTRRTGAFEYRVTLPGPGPYNPEQVEANLHEGVLTVRVPKAETAKPRRIEVQA